jgi:hypothetical protein
MSKASLYTEPPSIALDTFRDSCTHNKGDKQTVIMKCRESSGRMQHGISRLSLLGNGQ